MTVLSRCLIFALGLLALAPVASAQTADEIWAKLRAHVSRRAPGVELIRQGSMEPSKTPLDSPWAEPIRRAIVAARGEEPLLVPAPFPADAVDAKKRRSRSLRLDAHKRRRRLRSLGLVEHTGQVGDGRVLEQGGQRQSLPEPAFDVSKEADGEQGVPPQREKVVIDTNPAAAEQVGPEVGQGLLGRREERAV